MANVERRTLDPARRPRLLPRLLVEAARQSALTLQCARTRATFYFKPPPGVGPTTLGRAAGPLSGPWGGCTAAFSRPKFLALAPVLVLWGADNDDRGHSPNQRGWGHRFQQGSGALGGLERMTHPQGPMTMRQCGPRPTPMWSTEEHRSDRPRDGLRPDSDQCRCGQTAKLAGSRAPRAAISVSDVHPVPLAVRFRCQLRCMPTE